MAQEFRINSSVIEAKINQLLPSQGGSGAGVDFSASTMVIPIVDLTESAEGADVRQDLQTALSFGSATSFDVSNTTSTVITTTGYYRVFGANNLERDPSTSSVVSFILNDGTTDKVILKSNMNNENSNELSIIPFDFVIFLAAGVSFKIFANNAFSRSAGATRQIASIDGTLINP